MDSLVLEIYSEAIPFSPCEFFTGKEELAELMAKFLTAKGAEFCIQNDFPSEILCSRLKARKVAENGVYIDAGVQRMKNPRVVALAGDTEGFLEYDTAGYPCRLILMKGAKAHIKASGYSVVAVQAQDGCKYDIETKDNAIVR